MVSEDLSWERREREGQRRYGRLLTYLLAYLFLVRNTRVRTPREVCQRRLQFEVSASAAASPLGVPRQQVPAEATKTSPLCHIFDFISRSPAVSWPIPRMYARRRHT